MVKLVPSVVISRLVSCRKKEGRRKRKDYLPVAANPLLYSQTQIASFLRSSQLNRVIERSQYISDATPIETVSRQERNLIFNGKQKAAALSQLSKSISAEEAARPLGDPPLGRGKRERWSTSGGGGFIVEKESAHKVPRFSSCVSNWMCANCTLYNGVDEVTCVLCGKQKCDDIPAAAAVSEVDMPILPQTVTEAQESSDDKHVVREWKDLSDSDGDSWEDNDSDLPAEQPHPHHTIPLTPLEKVSVSAPEKAQGGGTVHMTTVPADDSPAVKCSLDLVNRAISSARSMGDWAGRAVSRALKAKEGIEVRRNHSKQANGDVDNTQLVVMSGDINGGSTEVDVSAYGFLASQSINTTLPEKEIAVVETRSNQGCSSGDGEVSLLFSAK